MQCKFKDCNKCKGALVLDGDEWRCWQCGTYYYPNEPVMDLPLESQMPIQELRDSDCEPESRRVRARRRTMTNINSITVSSSNKYTTVNIIAQGLKK